MRKTIIKVLSFVLITILVITLTGCGTSNSTKLEEFVEQNKSSVENLSNDIFTAELLVRDNSIVYKYTYKTTFTSDQIKAMQTTLESTLKEQSSTFKDVYTSIKSIDSNAESVIVEYYSGDNTLITSMEFK